MLLLLLLVCLKFSGSVCYIYPKNSKTNKQTNKRPSTLVFFPLFAAKSTCLRHCCLTLVLRHVLSFLLEDLSHQIGEHHGDAPEGQSPFDDDLQSNGGSLGWVSDWVSWLGDSPRDSYFIALLNSSARLKHFIPLLNSAKGRSG